MRVLVRMGLVCVCAAASMMAQEEQEKNDGPTNEKAQRTYQRARSERLVIPALEGYKKADEQDGGHCYGCQREMIRLGTRLGDWKVAEKAASEMVAEATDARSGALARYQLASVLMAEGFQKKNGEDFFARAHEELTKALAQAAEGRTTFADACYMNGKVLAQLHKDDEARAMFERYVALKPDNGVNKRRAQRYLSNIELARARMAPAFEVTTMDGRQLSMDELQGKVVLVDFWATWCQPCREAMPHIRNVAKKLQGEPLLVLSVSVDTDEKAWKEFVAKNEMTWAQYFDGGFTGPLAKAFSVHSIPHTFTIDSDGVLQDEQIGDGAIEGKLKKLIARARELPSMGRDVNGEMTRSRD
jgi:thiol-disulfide isomerase/thioredoxin